MYCSTALDNGKHYYLMLWSATEWRSPMKKEPLTPTLYQTLKFIEDHLAKTNGAVPPTSGDIARYFKITKSRACQHVQQLDERGWITHQPHKRWSIQLVPDQERAA